MLTREQNIFLAKKTFVELVYNTAYIEGCNVTFPQTQTIESLQWGTLRTGKVGVGDFIPAIPIREKVIEECRVFLSKTKMEEGKKKYLAMKKKDFFKADELCA